MRKIAPLPGFLHAELINCGKPTCRCARGDRHGPYWYRRWRENGRQQRQYVKPRDLHRARAAIAEWQSLHPPAYQARQALTELRRLLRLFDENGG